eukprot:CAMPEP_0113315874 /NCGR_PEP_ID=MMETSP0010_2-20120614/11364_1 /TAXON_ID=216773 ORGANISM="Corethron hystrix, Strain 308" /NCGR_SAMPLE_ID=MMETSP0010_2 /ASSEMBLY_ACC=CAM_ASM_000155 /LENGTH=543 /DNA_ID=CAMNT_0000172455 /DNA_START=33 /DNA_END=1661 /DNA_ORIENTATION=- /assembly_acc=CAM_ASM_000155
MKVKKLFLSPVFFNLLGNTLGYSTVIESSRIGFKHVDPIPGRGYSAATNSFYARCLTVGDDPPEPVFDFYYDIMSLEGEDTKLSSEFQGVFGESLFSAMVQELIEELAETGGVEDSHGLVSLMRADRYYNTIDESAIELDDNILGMMQRYDFTGVIRACGPSYVRGVRRSAEILTTFVWKTETGSATTREFESLLMLEFQSINVVGVGEDTGIGPSSGCPDAATPVGPKGDSETKKELSLDELAYDVEHAPKEGMKTTVQVEDHSAFETLTINVQGVGLDFSEAEDLSLVVTDMDDYADLMESAFGLLHSESAGAIKSIEIVPWIHEYNYQAAANTGLMVSEQQYRRFPEATKKVIWLTNAEHISRMYSIATETQALIDTMSRCLYVLHGQSRQEACRSYVQNKHNKGFTQEYYDSFKAFTQRANDQTPWDYNQDRALTDSNESLLIQAYRLKTLLDGMAEADSSTPLITKVTNIFHEWVTNYYEPCMSELSGGNLMATGAAIFTKHYMDIPACDKLTCIFPRVYWNSTGCLRGLGGAIQTDW